MGGRSRGLIALAIAALVWAGTAAVVPVSAASPHGTASAVPATSTAAPATHSAAAGPARLALGNGGWSWQNPVPHANTLLGMSCVGTSVCYAVGESAIVSGGSGIGGVVYTTTNGGAQWTDVSPAAASYPFFGVSCFDATHCATVGANGTAQYTSGGNVWNGGLLPGNPFLLGVSCFASNGCVTVGTGGYIAEATTLPTFPWTTLSSGVTTDLYGVSCILSTFCVAAGLGGVILTFDGSTWTRRTSNTTADLYSVSCDSTSLCTAVGKTGVVDTTQDGGKTWMVVANNGVASFDGVSCPDAGHCFMAGDDGLVYEWAAGQSPLGIGSTPSQGSLLGISCPSVTPTTVCFADGEFATIVTTTDGGAGWAVQQSFTPAVLDGMSCPGPTTCFAAGTTTGDVGVVAMTTNGTSWSSATVAGKLLRGMSCPSTTVCFAVGSGGTVVDTTDAGAHWTVQPAGTTAELFSVSCPTTLICYAGGSNGTLVATTDGGAHWNAEASQMTGELTGISCPGATRCFASISNIIDPVMGTSSGPGEIIATSDGVNWGLNFNLGSDPNAGTSGQFFAIACPTTSYCYAAGSPSAVAPALVAATSDGGQNWRTDNVANLGGVSINALSCPSAGVCYGASSENEVFQTTNFGGTWDAQFTGDWGDNFQGIACVDNNTCWVDGGRVAHTSTGGAAWSSQFPFGAGGPIHGLSCTDASNCYATAGDSLLASHDGGTDWTRAKLNTTDFLTSISCPAAGACFAVGWPHAVYRTTDAGATWTSVAPHLYGADDTLTGVSCAAATTCEAVGTQGLALSTTDGSSWAAEATGTTQLLEAVSCPSTTSCVAVGHGGTTLAHNPGIWKQYPSGTTNTLFGVDCPSAFICYAVGAKGTLLKTANGGGTWAAQTSGTTENLLGVRCATTTVCLAVGAVGTVQITTDGTTWFADVQAPTVDTLSSIAWGDLNHAWIGGNGGAILANSTVTSACGSITGGPQPVSPQDTGTLVTVSAAATGCPNPLYEFWMLPPGGSWTLMQGWSKTATFAWDSSAAAPGTYRFSVWARDITSNTSYDSFFAFPYTLTATTCGFLSTTVTPSSTSVQRGQPVQLTATATCPNPRFEFWLLPPGGGWTLAQAYSSSNTYNWNTFVPTGTYRWSVWVRDAGSSATYDDFGAFNYTITSTACTGLTASTSPSGTATIGTPVTLTMTQTGCPYAYIEVWVLPPGGSWKLLSGYQLNNTFTWQTDGFAPGTYRLSVWAQDGTAPSSYQAFTAFDYTLTTSPPCTSMSASATPPNTATIATMVTVTGNTANTCANPRFQFWLLPPSGGWRIVQAYSSNGTFNWDTTGWPAGSYRFSVWARDASSTASYDAFSALVYTLTVAVCQMQAASAAPASPQPAGTTVTITASATGCPNARFEFWVKDPAGNWTLLQAYSASSTYVWDTSKAPYLGMYYFSVWTRDAGSSNSYDSYSTFWYTLT